MPKITITIEADIDDLEAECFRNNMDEESLDGQADIVKDIMRLEGNTQPKIWWKIEQPKGFSYIQKIWKETAINSLPCLVSSAYPITIARDELRTRLTISFPNGGMQILIA